MKKTQEEYQAMGMDEKVANYFATGSKKLMSVKPNPDFTLSLFYENEVERIYDMTSVINKGGVFAFLKEKEHFNRVYVDECRSVCWDKDPAVDSDVVWSNKVDMCPDSMYMDSVPR